MVIKKKGMAGTIESSDITISIEPKEKIGIEIILKSSVEKQFGKQIKKVIIGILGDHGVESALVKVVDKGAIDYVIKARTETALYRAVEIIEYDWRS